MLQMIANSVCNFNILTVYMYSGFAMLKPENLATRTFLASVVGVSAQSVVQFLLVAVQGRVGPGQRVHLLLVKITQY